MLLSNTWDCWWALSGKTPNKHSSLAVRTMAWWWRCLWTCCRVEVVSALRSVSKVVRIRTVSAQSVWHGTVVVVRCDLRNRIIFDKAVVIGSITTCHPVLFCTKSDLTSRVERLFYGPLDLTNRHHRWRPPLSASCFEHVDNFISLMANLAKTTKQNQQPISE